MESNPSVSPRNSSNHPAKTLEAKASTTASMFNNAEKVRISGGTFSITTNNAGNGPLEVLYKRAAPNAILNAGGRADEARCHPGTREEVLSRIEIWRDAQDGQTPPIFWLSGPAGAGKTAIVQTIAERCNEEGIPQANFFFFRTDSSRNSVLPLVATLVHQIILLYPALRDVVAAAFTTNPLILDSVLEDQLVQLIVVPLQALPQLSPSSVPPLLLIDGLDECISNEKRSQKQILAVFDKVMTKYGCLFRLLVASRDESQIQAAFNQISSRLLPLYLDDSYFPKDDIRVFVTDELKKLQHCHPLGHTLDLAWPPLEDVEDIVDKSSGQFIYSATVVRFLQDSSASPKLSLARVKSAAAVAAISGTTTPFAQLDAIYTYILVQVNDQGALMDILRAQLFLQTFNSDAVYRFLLPFLKICDDRYTYDVVDSCLADVTSIARYNSSNQKLLFYHASFSDYLLNESRSRDYFVDLHAFNLQCQPAVWKNVPPMTKRGVPDAVYFVAFEGVSRLSQLPHDFLDVMITLPDKAFTGWYYAVAIDIFDHLYSLCNYEDDVTKYKQIVRQWTKAFVVKYGIPSTDKNPIVWRRWPAYVARYMVMTAVEASGNINVFEADPDWGQLSDVIPRDAADTHETAAWLTAVLHGIHLKETYCTDIWEYRRLIQEWVSWAAQNDIPLDGVDDVPNAKWYHAMASIERDVTADIALHLEHDCDIPETATWLKTLLHRIHEQKYYTNIEEYNQLLRRWTSWATLNNIPLEGVHNLPNVRWYLVQSRLEKWAACHLGTSNAQPWQAALYLLAITGLIIALCALHMLR